MFIVISWTSYCFWCSINSKCNAILKDEIGSDGLAKVVKGTLIPTGEKAEIIIMDKNQLFSDHLI